MSRFKRPNAKVRLRAAKVNAHETDTPKCFCAVPEGAFCPIARPKSGDWLAHHNEDWRGQVRAMLKLRHGICLNSICVNVSLSVRRLTLLHSDMTERNTVSSCLICCAASRTCEHHRAHPGWSCVQKASGITSAVASSFLWVQLPNWQAYTNPRRGRKYAGRSNGPVATQMRRHLRKTQNAQACS